MPSPIGPDITYTHAEVNPWTRIPAVGTLPECIDALPPDTPADDPLIAGWGVYLRLNPEHPANEGFGGVVCVGDFTERGDAMEVAAILNAGLPRHRLNPNGR